MMSIAHWRYQQEGAQLNKILCKKVIILVPKCHTGIFTQEEADQKNRGYQNFPPKILHKKVIIKFGAAKEGH